MRVADVGPAGERAGSRPARTSWGLVALVVLVVVHCVSSLLGEGDPSGGSFVGRTGMAAELAALVVSAGAVVRTRFAQREVVLGAAAVLVYCVGDAYYFVSPAEKEILSSGSPVDGAYVLYCLLMLAVIAHQHRPIPWPSLLNAAVAALASASVVALLLDAGVLDGSAAVEVSGSFAATVRVVLALLLMSAVGGVLASRHVDLGPRWAFFILGLVTISFTDNFSSVARRETFGPLLDIGWVLGISLIAIWLDGAGRTVRSSRQGNLRISESVTAVTSTLSALAVLVVSSHLGVSVPAEVLAAIALATAAVPLVFRNRMLSAQATTDELTGLPNRRVLLTEVPRQLDGRPGALFLMDLDRFKHVNDALGHDVGDALLVEVGKRFNAEVGSAGLFVRLGGDEFALFLGGASGKEAVTMAGRLGASLATPVEVGTSSLQVSVSIGIALTPANGTDLNLLMRKADIAMFRAKSGRSGHHVYDPADRDDGALRLKTIQELHTAFAQDQFELCYQPKVRLTDRGVVGMEALIRWNHPVRGQLPPVRFLALAEEAGLMPDLSALVLERAVEQIASWHRAGLLVPVAVNLSGSDITTDLRPRILTLLKRHDVPPERLMLEITEDILMADPVQTATIIRELRLEGIQLSIDDFGTGYSSLAYLRDLPVDEMKLDRSFISAMSGDERARNLVKSIIDLAHSLGLRVVAEGVDNTRAWNDLGVMGCDLAQGFHIARPLPARKVPVWIEEHGAPSTPEDARSLLGSAPDAE